MQASHYLYYYYNLLFVINSLILLNVCIEFITILLLFMLCFLAMRRVGSQLPGQGSNPHPLHWRVKSSPLKHQRNPQIYFKIETLYHYNDVIGLMLFLYMLKVKIALLQYKMCTYVPDKLTICTTTGRTSGKHWSLPTAFLKTWIKTSPLQKTLPDLFLSSF